MFSHQGLERYPEFGPGPGTWLASPATTMVKSIDVQKNNKKHWCFRSPRNRSCHHANHNNQSIYVSVVHSIMFFPAFCWGKPQVVSPALHMDLTWAGDAKMTSWVLHRGWGAGQSLVSTVGKSQDGEVPGRDQLGTFFPPGLGRGSIILIGGLFYLFLFFYTLK